MRDREELRERYEDALFAMMMDELASAEGEKALEENARLQEDPDAAVPERTDKRCGRTIRSHFRRVRLRSAGRTALRAAGRAAMVFGVISALFVGAFAASGTVRSGVLNLVVKTFGVSTDFYYEGQPQTEAPRLTVGWLPEGFALEREKSNEVGTTYVYGDGQGRYIYAMYVLGDGTVMSVDTEDAEVRDIRIGSADALLARKENSIQIVWGTEDRAGFVNVCGIGVSEEELVRMAKFITY